MADVPGFLLPHRVDVEPYEGTAAYGDLYGAKVPGVRCKIEDKRRQVRAANGEEVISETTVYARLSAQDTFKVGSKVQLPTRVAIVIVCEVFDDGNLGGWQHIAANLT